MASAMSDTSFVDLRRLREWFAAIATSATRATISIERVVARLGATCVPLLGRELCAIDPRRRAAARDALAQLATTPARARVIAELNQVAASAPGDDAKASALGLLAELGAPGIARFHDPSAIQRRCALALAARLASPADVAAAAELVVGQLADTDLPRLLEVMAETAPAGARALAAELGARLDVPAELRARLAETPIAAGAGEPTPPTPRPPRPTHATVLVASDARTVVVATRKLAGERRWRRWAVLVDAGGRIADAVHDDRATGDGDAATIVAGLVADGYRVTSADVDHARTIVAAAAARTGDALASGYYVGRDLLDLGDVHLRGAQPPSPLGRAVELLASEPARAHALLVHQDASDPDVAAALAAVALGRGEHAVAIAHLERAQSAEPAWPLHHWNLAIARAGLGDLHGAHAALRRFVTTSAVPAGYRSGLAGDPDQPGRVALAARWLAELERTARLAGTPITTRRNRARTRRRGSRSISAAPSPART